MKRTKKAFQYFFLPWNEAFQDLRLIYRYLTTLCWISNNTETFQLNGFVTRADFNTNVFFPIRSLLLGTDAETLCILFCLSELIQSNLNPFRLVVVLSILGMARLVVLLIIFCSIITAVLRLAQLKQCLNPLYKTS